MRHHFTEAAQRALKAAAAWSTDGCLDTLEAPAVLLGLLTETECRAAIALIGHGIDVEAVRGRWPDLTRRLNRCLAWGPAGEARGPEASGATAVRLLTPAVEKSFAKAARWLRNLGLPVELGTEHILLGLTAVDHEVSSWLQEHGVRPNEIEGEILRFHNLQQDLPTPGIPLPLPEDDSKGSTPPSVDGVPVVSHLPSGEGIEVRAWACESCGGERIVPMPDSPHPNPCPKGKGTSERWPDPPFRDLQPSSLPPDRSSLPPDEQLAAMRVIDAAANRAREGLRVVEDYVRFVLDDRFLTARLKELRHDLTAVVSRFSLDERIAARDTQADVGTQIATPTEQHRRSAANVLAANFTRLQESLRSLEEFAKLLDPDAAAMLEQLRYRSYTLHRATETTRINGNRLERARLYALIDGGATHEGFCDLARSLVSSGVHVLQLRDKRLDDRRLLERARALREITSEGGTLFIVNDRPDLAVLSRADGVHVGQEELAVKDVRAIVGPEAIVGVSTHSIESARQAVLDGASYLGVGPTFPSTTKHFEQFPGLELLRAVAAEIRLPAFAIGGITLENLSCVLETGLRRVAVSGAIVSAQDPGAAVRAFLAVLG